MKSPASLRSDRVATFPGLGGRFHRNTHLGILKGLQRQHVVTGAYVIQELGVGMQVARQEEGDC